MRIAYISLSGALLFGLGLAAGRPVAGEQYVCPMLPPAGISLANHPRQPPMVDGAMKFVGGAIMTFEGAVSDVSSPVWDVDAGERLKIGTLADMGRDDALEALDAAVAAWDGGQGEWPQLPLARRIAAIEALVVELKKMRSSLVDVLMWEIAKTADDAAKEFDRTMDFIAAVIAELRREPSGIFARALPPAALVAAPGQGKPAIIPDTFVRASLPAALTSSADRPSRDRQPMRRLLLDWKTVHAGTARYRTARARDRQSGAVEERAQQVHTEYLRHARQLDRR